MTYLLGYELECCEPSCRVGFYVPAELLLGFAQTRGGFTCPCGHAQHPGNELAAAFVNWVYRNRPDLVDPASRTKTSAELEAESEALRLKKLKTKMDEIDAALLRWFPKKETPCP